MESARKRIVFIDFNKVFSTWSDEPKLNYLKPDRPSNGVGWLEAKHQS